MFGGTPDLTRVVVRNFVQEAVRPVCLPQQINPNHLFCFQTHVPQGWNRRCRVHVPEFHRNVNGRAQKRRDRMRRVSHLRGDTKSGLRRSPRAATLPDRNVTAGRLLAFERKTRSIWADFLVPRETHTLLPLSFAHRLFPALSAPYPSPLAPPFARHPLHPYAIPTTIVCLPHTVRNSRGPSIDLVLGPGGKGGARRGG